MGPGRGAWVRGEGEVGVGPFAAQGFRAPVTDGWPPRWVAAATRSVVRRLCSVDSSANIKQYSGRWRDGWHARLEQRIQGEGAHRGGRLGRCQHGSVLSNHSKILCFCSLMFCSHSHEKLGSILRDGKQCLCFSGEFSKCLLMRRGSIGSNNKLLKIKCFSL